MILVLAQTAIGMAVVYFLLGVFVGGVNEWIATWRGSRGVFLKHGIRRMLPDQALYRRLMQHPLITALYRDNVAVGRPPSSIEPSIFAKALVDVITRRATVSGATAGNGTVEGLVACLDAIEREHPIVVQALKPIVSHAGNDYAGALKGIEAWFSSNTDRISGWYQAYTRKRLFAIGLVVAIVGNVDSIEMFHGFMETPALRQMVGDIGDEIAAKTLLGDPAEDAEKRKADAAAKLVEIQSAGLPFGFDCALALDEKAKEAATPTVVGDAPRTPSTGTNDDAGSKKGPPSVRGCLADMAQPFVHFDLLKIIGWLFTALAVSLGAPFWFDALSRIAPMRAVGPKPEPAAK